VIEAVVIDLAVDHAVVVAAEVAVEAAVVTIVVEHFTINQHTRSMELQQRQNTLSKLKICLQDAVGKI